MCHRVRIGSFIILIFVCVSGAATLTVRAQSNADAFRRSTITPETLSATFNQVAKSVEPAVVNIEIKGKVTEITVRGDGSGGSGSLADELSDDAQRQRRPSQAVGSGFIVDKAGFILTNLHVVEESSKIYVQLSTGEEFVATIVGLDEETDLAVIRIDAGRDLPVIKLGDAESARVGDWVLAIGSPFGLAQTVTAGIISQVKRETPVPAQFPKRYLQTDAAINRGNSGGPLVNMDGEVIGVNSQIATSTGDYNGIGFAFPINDAMSVYRQIRQNGRVRRGYLGLSPESVKPEFAKIYGLPDASGAIVLNISDKKGAAAAGGLLAGDVITEFAGKKIENATDLIAKVAATLPDESVTVVFYRENGARMERRTTTIKLSERPAKSRPSGDLDTPRKLGKTPPPLGLSLLELTTELVSQYNLGANKGLLVREIDQSSFLADVKASNGTEALVRGDLIQRINRVAVSDLKTFEGIAAALKKGDAVVLQVLTNNRSGRGGQLKFVQFTVR